MRLSSLDAAGFCWKNPSKNWAKTSGPSGTDVITFGRKHVPAAYSQRQPDRSLAYCGTSFHTPFSFLFEIVINCG